MEWQKPLKDEFLALSSEQRRAVHFILCERALKKWEMYIQAHNPIEYVETIVGTGQTVDPRLPSDAFQAARQGLPSPGTAARYLEPLAALQEEDLALPEAVTFAYYAIYNLFKKYAQAKAVDDWLITNQSLASEGNSDSSWVLLDQAIQAVK